MSSTLGFEARTARDPRARCIDRLPRPYPLIEPLDLGSTFVDLYHGTDARHAESIRVDGVDTSLQTYPRDFGHGFYTTRLRSQAEKWASWYAEPIVLHFRVEQARLDALVSKTFTQVSLELVEFVRRYRLGALDTPYDTVEGPVLFQPREFLAGAPPVWFGNQVAFFNGAGPLLNAAMR